MELALIAALFWTREAPAFEPLITRPSRSRSCHHPLLRVAQLVAVQPSPRDKDPTAAEATGIDPAEKASGGCGREDLAIEPGVELAAADRAVGHEERLVEVATAALEVALDAVAEDTEVPLPATDAALVADEEEIDRHAFVFWREDRPQRQRLVAAKALMQGVEA